MLSKYIRAAIQCFGAVVSSCRNDAAAQRYARHKMAEVVRMLQNEEWAQLRQQFTPILRWMLTESTLQKGFQILQLSAGPIVHFGEPVVSTGWFTSAKIPVEFRRVKLGMSILMSPSGTLLNLRFYPQRVLGFGSSWSPPNYLVKSSFREIEIEVGAPKVRSAGTLTLPAQSGMHPCIVMLPGSGPCDRDSSVGSAKPFKDLALGLATAGVATLRFDKITYTQGAKIRGRKSFTLEEEYMSHALDAVRQASEHEAISPGGLFVLGHSLGAYVAPRVMTADSRIAGCIIMAGPASPLCWSALRQYRYFASIEFGGEATDHPEIDDLQRQCDLSSTPDLSLCTPTSKLPFGLGPAYWRDFANFRPIETCRDEKRPVLVLQGARDYQVTVDDDFAHWRAALRDKGHAKLAIYDDLNHLFIAGKGQPSPREYDDPGNVDVVVIRDISRWVSEKAY